MGKGEIIRNVIENVPDYKTFLTLEEFNESSEVLAEKYPKVVKISKAGVSREGRTIKVLKIGRGKRRALIFGCPHPNEPVGAMMLEYFSHVLAENADFREIFHYTWYIIKVADPDGLKLNEGWLKGPYSPYNYAKNFYRPAGNRQVEWTFPIKYKTLNFDRPIPETRALMNIIERNKPDFIYSLHNAGFGGVYYYISQEAPLLYPIFHKAAEDQKVPLSLGEPEMPYAVQLDRAIFYMPSIPETYEYLNRHVNKDPAEIIKSGTSSIDYARRFNKKTFELITEVPYYFDVRISDMSETDVQRKKAVLDSVQEEKKIYAMLSDKYGEVKAFLTRITPFREAIEYFLTVIPHNLKAKEHWAKMDPSLNRKATVAEVFDNYQVNKFYNMLMLGMFIRMLDAEIKASKNKTLLKVKEEVSNMLSEINKKLESELHYEVIPLKKLVAIQLMAGLYSALYTQTI
jgi:hypothetical protein